MFLSTGGPFKIETLERNDVKAGLVTSSWIPKAEHPAIPPDQVVEFSKIGLCGMLLATSAGALKVSTEWNQLLPEYTFSSPESFLSHQWKDKP